MLNVNAQDKSSKLDVKTAILARSGIYIYSRDEVLKWGVKPKQVKPFYREYRPAGVLVEAKDLFSMVPITNGHPATDITEANFHTFASGVTGGPIEAVTLESGEIGLQGKVAFFTRDAYDAYNDGSKETSTGFEKVVREVSNADEAGYDFILEKIRSVNHMAVVPRGRGGSSVRVMDSAAVIDTSIGGIEMAGQVRSGILERLGIVKAKDANFKFSDVLLGSVAKVHSLDEAGLGKEIASVMAHVNGLGEGEAKEVLVGMVSDCFKHPVEVIAAKDKIAGKIDELYISCRDADSAVVQRILDASADKDKDVKDKDDKEKDADKDGKDKGEKKPVDAKDAAALSVDEIVERAVQKAVVAVTDSFDTKIDEHVKNALGLGMGKKSGDNRPAASGVAVTDSAGAGEDASFMVRGYFGNN